MKGWVQIYTTTCYLQVVVYICRMAPKTRKSDCPINFALEIFGDKWTFLIVRDLMFKGNHYYGEFLKMEEKIATNILADRLALLEISGIVTSTIDEQNNSKKINKLTPKGIHFIHHLPDVIL